MLSFNCPNCLAPITASGFVVLGDAILENGAVCEYCSSYIAMIPEPEIPHSASSCGGSYIFGSVSCDGDFVGGNKIEIKRVIIDDN